MLSHVLANESSSRIFSYINLNGFLSPLSRKNLFRLQDKIDISSMEKYPTAPGVNGHWQSIFTPFHSGSLQFALLTGVRFLTPHYISLPPTPPTLHSTLDHSNSPQFTLVHSNSLLLILYTWGVASYSDFCPENPFIDTPSTIPTFIVREAVTRQEEKYRFHLHRLS